jgi:hypothetical protein
MLAVNMPTQKPTSSNSVIKQEVILIITGTYDK